MKKLSFAIILLLSVSAFNFTFAKVDKIIIGVDGFTCSLCAKGVEGQLKSIGFVKSVKTDLKKTQFILTVKSGKKINVKELNDAVEDGGFTLREVILEGTGTIDNSNGSMTLNADNIAGIYIKNVPDGYAAGNKVSFKGRLSSNDLNLITLKKE